MAHLDIYAVVIMLGVSSIVRNVFALRLFNHAYNAFYLDWRGGLNIVVAVLLALIVTKSIETFVPPGLLFVAAGMVFLLSLVVLRPLAHDELDMVKKGVGARLARPLTILARG